MSDAMDKFLDQLAMHKMGSDGTTCAHMFLQDRLARPLRKIDDLRFVGGSYKKPIQIFIPAKENDRVLMFHDYSGVYVFESGFCSIMGSDISQEVLKWERVDQWKDLIK